VHPDPDSSSGDFFGQAEAVLIRRVKRNQIRARSLFLSVFAHLREIPLSVAECGLPPLDGLNLAKSEISAK
jgi:hypothetical protein